MVKIIVAFLLEIGREERTQRESVKKLFERISPNTPIYGSKFRGSFPGSLLEYAGKMIRCFESAAVSHFTYCQPCLDKQFSTDRLAPLGEKELEFFHEYGYYLLKKGCSADLIDAFNGQ